MTAVLAAIIPTRNRAQLASNAVRSLLDQDCPMEIFLSDNSTSPNELRDVFRESRVHYLRPPGELRMAEHWDWAVREAMDRSNATHFAVHYDRKVSKPRHWGALAAAASRWPDLLFTYTMDLVVDHPPPLSLLQVPWTGNLFLLQTARIAALIAAGRVGAAYHALPILSNCVVPRDVLRSIVDRFGNVCSSTGPDSCFTARFIALHDRFLHYDRALAVAYAYHRSSGLGFLRGGGGDWEDWKKTWGDRPWLDAAPLAGISLGQNMLFHEYELVRRETGDRLPPLDPVGYLNELGVALQWVRDPQTRGALRRTLEEHGWNGNVVEPQARPFKAALREKVILFLMDHFGFVPPQLHGFAFPNDEKALYYALKYPRPPQTSHDHLAVLEPVQVPQ